MTAYRRLLSIALVMTVLFFIVLFSTSLLSVKADSVAGKLGKTNTTSVNVRYGKSTGAKLLFQIPSAGYVGTIKDKVYNEKIWWYKMEFRSPEAGNNNYYTGYVNSQFIDILSDEEAQKYKMGDTIIAGSTTPPPSGGSGDAPSGTYGVITAGGVNFRTGPGTNFSVITQLNRGDKVTVLTIPDAINSNTFYFVRYGKTEGFIMSTFLSLTSEGGSSTPTPTTPTDVIGYVTTIKGGVNLRQTPGGTVITTVKKNQTYGYLLKPVSKGGYTWYFVQADSHRGYLRGDCVKVVSEPKPTNSTTTTPPPTTTAAAAGYVKTTAGGVNFRKSAGYTDVLGQINKGEVLPYYEATTVKGVKWYKVYSSKLGKTGYLHGNYVTLCDKNGNTNNGSSSSATATIVPENGKTEATYSTLKLGSTGNAVKNLTAELKRQGYFSGTETDKYTSAVETAVRNFQKAKKLTVDGIAGPATQHALYNTVPVGEADKNNRKMTLYPAEKIDWFTGGIRELWPKGANFKVYDVKSGKIWWAHRWSGGNHADVEPLTATDTKIICDWFGVSNASQINASQHWQRRPSLVTIGTRTFACSLYAVPHNPDGDTIANNNMTGQICLHFTNSKTHDSKKIDSGHQEAIQYAYDWSHGLIK